MNHPPLPHLIGDRSEEVPPSPNKPAAVFLMVMAIISVAIPGTLCYVFWQNGIGIAGLPFLLPFIVLLGGGSIHLFRCGIKFWTGEPFTKARKHE